MKQKGLVAVHIIIVSIVLTKQIILKAIEIICGIYMEFEYSVL